MRFALCLLALLCTSAARAEDDPPEFFGVKVPDVIVKQNEKLDAIQTNTEATNALLETIESKIDTLLKNSKPIPQAPAAPVAKADEPVVEVEKSPTLLLFSSRSCVPCKPEEARVKSLEAAGEIVQVLKVEESATEFDVYGVEYTPTWIRLENGKEVGRVPGKGQKSYLNSDRDKLLRIAPAAPKPAKPAKVATVVPSLAPPQNVVNSRGEEWYWSGGYGYAPVRAGRTKGH